MLNWTQWDALHYVRIAEAGYPVGGPGYPAFTGRSGTSPRPRWASSCSSATTSHCSAWLIAAGQLDGWLGPRTLGTIIDAGSMLAAVILLALCVTGRFRFRADQLYLVAYSALSLALVLSTEVGGRALQSAPRYAMEAVAIVLVLARMGAWRPVDRFVLTVGMTLHALLLAVYMTGTYLIA
ncbi:hypothetical protein [Catenuloplanes japonicus]|uniref:hypothetical protein n=1 Tax=Catenuloplanes japonicus TaxID=33876 RepID=UPI000A6415F8|nr:hypothetical protein [Catenuloplanes japonicus]